MTSAPAELWLAVVGLGLFHGLNPAMGWPLAVANGLSERRGRAVFATLVPLGAGHALAMAVALLPFALLAWVAAWNRELRVAAGALVMAFGVWKLVNRRHPRFLARVRPTQLTWWSFLMATAHGAGLMLVPITLGLCAQMPLAAAGGGVAQGGAAAGGPAPAAIALTVAGVHTLAMIGSGLALAWAVYRWLGLAFLRKSWFDLDAAWAICLVATGGIGCAQALAAGR